MSSMRFHITSMPDRTVVELIYADITASTSAPLPVVGFATLRPADTIFTLRVSLLALWRDYHFSSASEHEPLPPLPPVQWSYVP